MRQRCTGTVIDFPIHRVRAASSDGPGSAVIVRFPTRRPAPVTDARLERMRRELVEMVEERRLIGGVSC